MSHRLNKYVTSNYVSAMQRLRGHSKRRIGSIGERDLPGWIAKGKRMPGHMGAVQRTARNLAVVQVRKDDNVLLVRGAVPGPAGATVIVRKALKKA